MNPGILFGLGAAVIISGAAWRLRALDTSGAIAACVVGIIIFAGGGLIESIALLTFFLSGSALSRLPGGVTIPSGNERHGRSWKQVLANGLIPTLAVVVAQLLPSLTVQARHAFFGALAAATADTWATELGTRFGSRPRDILHGTPAIAGISGGVSTIGLMASLAGGALIAAVAIVPLSISPIAGHLLPLWVSIVISGFVGSVADSILGSAVQAKYRCAACGRIVETPDHCDRQATRIHGYRYVTNNVVNFIASALGALLILGLLDLT